MAGGTRSRLDLQLNEARRELAGLEAQSLSVTHLRSQVAGRVVEIRRPSTARCGATRGGQHRAGVDGGGNGGGLEAVMYVSASDGKKIAANDQVELVPRHARKEEHGVLRASVKSTSAYPATPQG